MTAEALPDGHHGWVEFGREVSVQPVQWTLRASLSRRELYVVRDNRIVRTISVFSPPLPIRAMNERSIFSVSKGN